MSLMLPANFVRFFFFHQIETKVLSVEFLVFFFGISICLVWFGFLVFCCYSLLHFFSFTHTIVGSTPSRWRICQKIRVFRYCYFCGKYTNRLLTTIQRSLIHNGKSDFQRNISYYECIYCIQWQFKKNFTSSHGLNRSHWMKRTKGRNRCECGYTMITQQQQYSIRWMK